MESALMTTPPVFRAAASASADLPLAVGPAISTAVLLSARGSMSLVATLICHPANPALDSTVLDGARAILPLAGPARWLFDEVAADIPFGDGSEDIAATAKRLRAAREDLPIDIVVQPAIARRKKLFLADMDSTMIGQECIDELADFVGLKAHVATITERAMRGEIEFEPALRERVALLKGLSVDVVDKVIQERITLTRGGRNDARAWRRNLSHLWRLHPVHASDRQKNRVCRKPRQRIDRA